MTINNFTDGLFKHAKISFNYIVLCIYFLEDLCQLNDNKTGVCLSISKCWTEINMEILKWLAQNNSLITCSFIDYTPLICCPTNFIPGMIAKSSKILFVFLIIIIFILKSSFLYFFFSYFFQNVKNTQLCIIFVILLGSLYLINQTKQKNSRLRYVNLLICEVTILLLLNEFT